MPYGPEHPDFDKEQAYLASTVSALEATIEEHERPRAAQPAYRDGQRALSKELQGGAAELRQARQEPFFARIDFQREGSEGSPQRIYLGRVGIREQLAGPILVHDWRARIAQLFYRARFLDATYENGAGQAVHGTVSLRRQFRIRDALLEHFTDERLLPAETLEQAEAPRRDASQPDKQLASLEEGEQGPGLPIDDALRAILAESRDGTLRDIVATIQAQQYALIEAPLEGALLVQGTAGSGKTSVALHRLAYLLYAHQERLQARNTLVLAPSELFLSSIVSILPNLNERDVQQMTFLRWAERQLGASPWGGDTSDQIEETPDKTVRRLARLAHQGVSRLKGSLRMGRLIAAYLRVLERHHLAHVEALRIDYQLPREEHLFYTRAGVSITLDLARSTIQETIRDVAISKPERWSPLNSRRELAITRLYTYVWRQFQEHSAYNQPLVANKEERERILARRMQAFEQAVRPVIVRRLRHWWPNYTAEQCYRMLVGVEANLDAAIAQLKSMSDEEITPWERALLLQPQLRAKHVPLTVEDVPALCCLDLYVNGQHLPEYEYVVIDEAQDVTPLQLWVIARHTKGRAMTLVGDVAQAINSSGIATWDELSEVLTDTPIQHHQLTVSYRATYEITDLANRLLEHMYHHISVEPALPVARSGEQPKVSRWSSREQLISKLKRSIADARKRGAQSIAILCKTATSCTQLATELDAAGLNIQVVLSRNDALTGDAVLMPVRLAKGLEFDTVLLPDVDEETYPDTLEDTKLLYVGITRALHEVQLFWTGKPAPVLSPDRQRKSTSSRQ